MSSAALRLPAVWRQVAQRAGGPAGVLRRTRLPCPARHAAAPWRARNELRGFSLARTLPLRDDGAGADAGAEAEAAEGVDKLLPEENEAARLPAYHDAFVWKAANADKIAEAAGGEEHDGGVGWERLERLTEPTALVALLNRFASMRVAQPEVFAAVEQRAFATDDAVRALSGQYLSRLAWAYAAAGAGSAELFERVRAAADALSEPLQAHDQANLDWALRQAAERR